MDLKKNGWKQTLSPPTPPPVEGRIQVGQERRKVRRKEKWWKWAEISREERQGLEGGCVTDSFRTILFYIIVNCSYFIFFIFLSVNCLLLIFFLLFNLCGFFLLSFVFFVCLFLFFYVIRALFFVGFGGLGLPCHLLCCLLLFVFCFFFNSFLFFFFTFMDFLGLFFVSLTALGTSSLRLIVFPLGVVARGPRFADWYRGVVSYTNDDLGKRVAWLT